MRAALENFHGNQVFLRVLRYVDFKSPNRLLGSLAFYKLSLVFLDIRTISELVLWTVFYEIACTSLLTLNRRNNYSYSYFLFILCTNIFRRIYSDFRNVNNMNGFRGQKCRIFLLTRKFTFYWRESFSGPCTIPVAIRFYQYFLDMRARLIFHKTERDTIISPKRIVIFW